MPAFSEKYFPVKRTSAIDLFDILFTETSLRSGPPGQAVRTGPPGQAVRTGLRTDELQIHGERVPRFTAEFWTPRQRQASSLHEISYRACFKPQLPRFFIERLTVTGDLVYDPFMGRGTTLVEAALLGRLVAGNDSNPLSRILTEPRFNVPYVEEIVERMDRIGFIAKARAAIDLSMFYHPKTLAEIVSLQQYLRRRKARGREDHIDRWIRMVATNRLTGHSSGFFSVYTLPPNQAATPQNQRKINRKRRQTPAYRDVKDLILKKSRALLRNLSDEQRRNLSSAGRLAKFLTGDAWCTRSIHDDSIQLTVTSPPFLDTVNYAQDNWLRCWFNGINHETIGEKLTVVRSLEAWRATVGQTFRELHRITRPGGYVAFEVGEIRRRNLRLDEVVVPLGIDAGFACMGILINQQRFTKTSNIWGIRNNRSGTNTNRIVLFKKPSHLK